MTDNLLIEELSQRLFDHLDELANELPVEQYYVLMQAIEERAKLRAEAVKFEFL